MTINVSVRHIGQAKIVTFMILVSVEDLVVLPIRYLFIYLFIYLFEVLIDDISSNFKKTRWRLTGGRRLGPS